jgi:integral membrane protein
MMPGVTDIKDPAGTTKALTFFKTMAIMSGLALFVLIAIVILNGGFGMGGASAVWSPIHGMIYFVYVISIANLGFKVGWSLPKMVGIMLTGFVPLLPFWAERRFVAEVEGRLAPARR